MKSDKLRERLLNRIAHTRQLKISDLEKLDDAEIIKQFWHFLKISDIDHFDESAIDDCEIPIERIKARKFRNERFGKMAELEKNGYFELSKGLNRTNQKRRKI
jgi:hypothetical protein